MAPDNPRTGPDLLLRDKIVVVSTALKHPKAVRYGWADCPADVNLFNKNGLPATPFRLERF